MNCGGGEEVDHLVEHRDNSLKYNRALLGKTWYSYACVPEDIHRLLAYLRSKDYDWAVHTHFGDFSSDARCFIGNHYHVTIVNETNNLKPGQHPLYKWLSRHSSRKPAAMKITDILSWRKYLATPPRELLATNKEEVWDFFSLRFADNLLRHNNNVPPPPRSSISTDHNSQVAKDDKDTSEWRTGGKGKWAKILQSVQHSGANDWDAYLQWAMQQERQTQDWVTSEMIKHRANFQRQVDAALEIQKMNYRQSTT